MHHKNDLVEATKYKQWNIHVHIYPLKQNLKSIENLEITNSKLNDSIEIFSYT